MPTSGDYSLYFHIPFCSRKCDYCHFYVLPDKESLKDDLLKAFKLEWESIRSHFDSLNLKSIYFGGGTPFLLGPKRLSEVLSWLPPAEEITLEMNPENDANLLKEYRSLGVNRLSIGLQTLTQTELVTLGRTHTTNQSLQSVISAHNAGFDNISVDLMYDLPDQTLHTWEKALNEVTQLPITHLSLYNLTIEPHTVFHKYRNQIEKRLPSTTENFYELAQQKLTEAGLNQYEISAFAKPGKHSLHNTGYWLGRPFWGLGPSAFSYWNGSRFRNVSNLSKYSTALKNNESPIDFTEKLDPDCSAREAFLLKLRLSQGTALPPFKLPSLPDLLEITDNRVRLTQKGILFYDTVASEIV